MLQEEIKALAPICLFALKDFTGAKISLYSELDGNDRTTVLAHFFCDYLTYSMSCINFDTGVVSEYVNNMGWQQPLTIEKDMPENCLLPECDGNKWIDQAFDFYGETMWGSRFVLVLKGLPPITP